MRNPFTDGIDVPAAPTDLELPERLAWRRGYRAGWKALAASLPPEDTAALIDEIMPEPEPHRTERMDEWEMGQ